MKVNDLIKCSYGSLPEHLIPIFESCAQVNRFVGFNLLSEPSKMPEESFNIPAVKCKAGSYMVKLKDWVCFGCYALKGRYGFDNVITAMDRRYKYATNSPYWVDCMTYLINHKRGGKSHIKHFRWFDSGDLQDKNMLDKICKICRATPNTKHWLPTKEPKLMKRYLEAGNKLPDNLCIRVSTNKKDCKPKRWWTKRLGLVTSTVVSKEQFAKLGFKCPSSKQDNQCKDCRACWNKGVKNVPYKYH